MPVREIEFGPGTHIEQAATLLVEAARLHGSASGHFNDVQLNANSSSTAAQIVEDFNAESLRRRADYERSPAGLKAKSDAEQRRRDHQSTHDRLMASLPALDFSDQNAVLNWVCAMQAPSDHNGVIVKRQTIVAAFAAAGFAPNVNIGADYKPGNRDNMFRYLVGQALAGLAEGPAIHPIIHKFADEWRAAFINTTVH